MRWPWVARRDTFNAVFGTPEGRKVLVWLRVTAGMPFGPYRVDPVETARYCGRQEILQEIQITMGLTDAECLRRDNQVSASERFEESA